MSASPEISPAQLELDGSAVQADLESLEGSPAPGFLSRTMGVVTSPIGMGVCVLLAILILAAALIGSGTVQVFGKQQSDESGALETDGEIVAEETVEQTKPEAETDDDKTDEDVEPQDAFSSEYGSITFSDEGAVYHTVPTTVQLQSKGTRTQLTLSVGIVTDAESAERLLENGLSVNLIKIQSAESLDLGPYLDWQLPGLVTKDVKRRLELAYPDLSIRGIMIRDFNIT